MNTVQVMRSVRGGKREKSGERSEERVPVCVLACAKCRTSQLRGAIWCCIHGSYRRRTDNLSRVYDEHTARFVVLVDGIIVSSRAD